MGMDGAHREVRGVPVKSLDQNNRERQQVTTAHPVATGAARYTRHAWNLRHIRSRAR
ncbi:hypothetical protein PCAR4_290179 [Paraburkholderia caribensis]|nr:hypothetical protein PCAR4_290179 [Paraburkholderia caribensis]